MMAHCGSNYIYFFTDSTTVNEAEVQISGLVELIQFCSLAEKVKIGTGGITWVRYL